MIAPRPALVAWAAAVALPLTIVSAVLPSWRALTLPAILLFCLIALVDLLWKWRQYRDVEFIVPDTIRTIAGRAFQLSLRLAAPSARSDVIRVGVALPASLSAVHQDVFFRLRSNEQPQLALVELEAANRGVFFISQLFFDWVSPFGWWIYRERRAVHCQIRVYPDLTAEGRQLARFLKRNEIGIHHYRHWGRGREFEKLREYEPGDSFDSIHWKATAKRRRPITKVYQVEKAQEVYVAIDSSRLSGRLVANEYAGPRPTGRPVATLERTIAASLLFCAAAQNQGDLFGLLTFSDKVDHLVTARSGPAHFNRCRDVLAGLQTRLVSPDFGEIASTVMTQIKRRALVIFLTSLDDPVISEAFLNSMDFVARRHLVLAVMLLAPSIRPLFAPPGVEKLDDIYQNIAGHVRWTHLIELRRQLRQRGIQLCLVTNQNVSLEMVGQYLALKRRQAL
jgi:uncharacterized protein (DUF58 family)